MGSCMHNPQLSIHALGLVGSNSRQPGCGVPQASAPQPDSTPPGHLRNPKSNPPNTHLFLRRHRRRARRPRFVRVPRCCSRPEAVTTKGKMKSIIRAGWNVQNSSILWGRACIIECSRFACIIQHPPGFQLLPRRRAQPRVAAACRRRRRRWWFARRRAARPCLASRCCFGVG